MKIVAAIMAGGKGERFWPKSRAAYPKQFLSLTGDGLTMLQHTVKRLLPLVSYEDMFIVTNRDYIDIIRQQVPQIPPENLLAEPMAKNTSPCIGFAAAVMAKKYGDAMMLVLPADHLIRDEKTFIKTLENACEAAKDGENILTMGITPNYPETGYGYINFVKESKADGVYPVKRFVEKPDRETAEKYLADGGYLWNSGMFVWKLSTILKTFEKLHPDIYPGLLNIQKAVGTSEYEAVLTKEFSAFPSVSIDYGVMEKADDIYTIPCSMGWDDVGSWLAIEKINEADENGNILWGNTLALDTENTIIAGDKRVIAAIGLKDLIIVDTDDALLVCDKNKTQDVKRIIEMIKSRDNKALL